ncbi:MAG: flagellar filament capping protein FliD [Salinibacterium sp.]|nr:flagellar filament capping protein FliD [Salinibacterium sp.]
MGSLAIDGLVSGLDTTSLINQLMTVESQPQTLLKAKVSSTQTLVSAFQGLNTSVASLASLAKKTALPASVDLFTATSSAASVSVTAAPGSSTGQIDLSVTSVAKAQVSVSAAMTAWPDSPATFTIVTSDGTKVELTAASTSMSDVADAINGSSAGVKATRVSAGTDSGTGDPLYRLQLTSAATGASGAFQVFRGTAADVTAGTAPDLFAAPGAATVTSAADASVTLWAGTAAEQVITSSTNTFADILPGLSVTVSSVEASPVTVSVAKDTAGISSLASNLVANLTAVFNFIGSKSVVSQTTSSTGAAVTTAGVFTGNSTAREMNSLLLTAASAPVAGRSPSEIGITITKDGGIEYDSAKFTAALAADPAGTQAMFQTIADRVATAADAGSNQYTGTITQVITGQQSSLTSLNDQIASWDVRLAAQRTSLERTYSALEVSLSNLKAQSSWLTSQLAALTTSTG